MTVLLVGVGADSGNVKPAPEVDEKGRFEYIPIPEKSRETTETRTYGSLTRRYGDGRLVDLVDGLKPHGDADWIDRRELIRDHPVHYDPNLDDLSYGEGGKDQNVNAIEAGLSEGDVIAFYTGLRTNGYMHRYLFGYFTVAEDPRIIEAATPVDTTAEILGAHPTNAHAKRFEGNGELYAFDPDKPRGASRVAIVDGEEPGGLLDRAVPLNRPENRGNYYMTDDVESALAPDTTYLGGFKPPIHCDVEPDAFVDFVWSSRGRPP